ncbi:MAG: hypothetical protein VYA32_08655 [Planctomycetota bacterium]|nr:hypothetical protein [Planctomycetota bacterium]MEE3365230.1 hypothetical protein [Planctomycetota bacterium]
MKMLHDSKCSTSPLLLMLTTAMIGLCTDGATARDSNSLMDISQDGRLLACSNRDSGTVTIVDLATLKKLRETRVGVHPEGVAFLGKTHNLAVAVYNDDQVTLLNADSGKVTQQVEVFDEPYGIVSNADGSRFYVTLEYPGRVIEISNSGKILRQFPAGSFPRGLALSPDGRTLYTAEYYSARVNAINVADGKIVDTWKGASTDNLCRQIVLHPTRPKAYIPHIRSRIAAAQGEGSIFPYVGVVDTKTGEGRRRKRIPMDSFLGNLVTANPWEIDVSADGKKFFVVFSGTDDMFLCETVDDDYTEIKLSRRITLGHNPRAVRVSPDGARFFVYNALDFNVVAYDANSARPLATINVTDNPLSKELHRGKVLFYTALQPMVGRRWISCSSCHPDGDPDGRTWQNPEGLRATPPLFGLAWTHPLHWSADRDESQDFEHTIRGPLMQGRGLVRGGINQSLEKPNKGLSADLDALAAYTNSHRFTLSPYARKGLSTAAQRGRSLFRSTKVGCAKCHSGPFFTDSRPRPKPLRHDVGSGTADPSEKMGPAYDTPMLLGLYRSAPYLHHGKAATLTDVLTTFNKNDRHGTTSHLDKQQVADLVEFLKALPYEDPAAAAQKAGLTKVAR